MTKNTKLVWRLKEQPTPQSLRELVKDGILTKDQAQEILFSLETQEERDVSSLKSEIKFLRELVEKLSSSRNRTIEIIREIEKPYRRWTWYEPYDIWCETTWSSFNTDGTSSSLYLTTSGSDGFTNISTF